MPNGEGYPDPTADIAIGRVTRWEKRKKKRTKGGKTVYNYDTGSSYHYDAGNARNKDGGPGSGNWGHGGRPGKLGGSTGGGGVKNRKGSKESGYISKGKGENAEKGGLTHQPRSITKGYTGGNEGTSLNELLRYEPAELSPTQKEVVKTMDNAMEKMKSPITLYRGVDFNFTRNQLGISAEEERKMSFEDLKNRVVGTEYTDKGYTSTTYASDHSYGSGFKLIINAKEGTKAIWTGNDEEKEIVIGRNQTFKISDVRQEKGNIVFEVETVN